MRSGVLSGGALATEDMERDTEEMATKDSKNTKVGNGEDLIFVIFVSFVAKDFVFFVAQDLRGLRGYPMYSASAVTAK